MAETAQISLQSLWTGCYPIRLQTLPKSAENPPKQPSLFRGSDGTFRTAVTILNPHCQSIFKNWSDSSASYLYPHKTAVTTVTVAGAIHQALGGDPAHQQLRTTALQVLADRS